MDCPDHVEELEADEESVEDVVGGEHVDVLLGGVQGGVQHTGGEEVTPRHSGPRDMIQGIINIQAKNGQKEQVIER